MSTLRILIADDHEVARKGIRALLETRQGWEICGEAKDGREAVECAKQMKPDVVLLDIGMPSLNGLDAARQIRTALPETSILILTMHDSEQVVREVLAVGARGFLLKSDAGRDLVAAVEALQQRRTFFTTRVAQLVVEGYLHPNNDNNNNNNKKESSRPTASDAQGTRSDSASGRGKNHQRSRCGSQPQCQNGGNAPNQPHA